MKSNSLLYLWIVIQIIVFFIANKVSADESGNEESNPDYKWFVSIYGGVYTDRGLTDCAMLDVDYTSTKYIVVAALAREFYRFKQLLSFELEGQVGKHLGSKDDQWEFVGAMLGRWHAFPWDNYIRTSFAFGAGLSYNSEISQIEYHRDENAEQLLGYLAFEATFGLPQNPRWDLMLRVHHRSGLQGIIGEGISNYVCAGIKYAF